MAQSNVNVAAGTGLAVALLLVSFAALPRLLGGASGGGVAGKEAPDFTVDLVLNPADALAPVTIGTSIPSEAATAASENALAASNLPSPKMTLSALRGKAVVLDFWATWCGPCKAEAPILNGIAKRYRGRDVVVVGVNTDDGAGNAAAFAQSRGLVFPIAYDGDSSAARAYGVTALPTLVVVSKTGKIVAVRTGLTSDTELDELIKEALNS
jgi:cytochrome c biogenesis protein CcmG, thiol:disulfide interchange protein DsbE